MLHLPGMLHEDCFSLVLQDEEQQCNSQMNDFTVVSFVEHQGGLWQLLMNQCNLTEFIFAVVLFFFARIRKKSTIRRNLKKKKSTIDAVANVF